MATYTLGLTRTIGHGRAFSQRTAPTNPAAGASLTIKPTGTYWFIGDSLSLVLTTSATAALRSITLAINDSDGVAIATVPSSLSVTASTTAHYTWLGTANQETGSDNGPILNIYPQMFIQPGYTIVATVANIQTGDQISGIRHCVQRFDTGTEGYLLGPYVDTDPAFVDAVKVSAVLS